MARQRSFTSYVADRFYNELFAAINDYAETNSDNLNLRRYQVNRIGGINCRTSKIFGTEGRWSGIPYGLC